MTTTKTKRPSRLARFMAGTLSLLISLGPIATPAYADLTKLADQPLGAQVKAKPNIVLTIDDSTSMLDDFLPDYVVSTYCRDAVGARNASCGWDGASYDLDTGGKYLSPQYIWEQFGFPFQGYSDAYSASGPGAGCNLVGSPPTCSPGISPGALPGIAKYPGASGSPKANQNYEYWLMWPAPAHNSEFNRLYYNPRLTYLPPVKADGTSYPTMDSPTTSGWTKVPANPFLHLDNPWGYPSDTNAPLVDLTATVTVGQWCNSDWTQGNDDGGNAFSSNPDFCRVNGNLSDAGSDSTPANLGDYNYPWAPASIVPNDWTSKVDMSTINIASTPPVNASIKTTAWTNAQDGKYFYENDNVLWCDISSPDWPQTGDNPLGQTCSGYSNTQTCNANPITPTCGGGATGTCAGYVGAGTCTNLFTTGTCAGGTSTGVCNGYSAGICTGYQAGTCAGGSAAKCNNIPTCNGAAAAACTGQTRQACTGAVAASCGGKTGQTCNGGVPVACNPQSQTCNGYQGAQTCDVVEVYQDPATCPSQWVPPECNPALPGYIYDPERTCNYKPVCTPIYKGTCSRTGNTCTAATAATDCPVVNGTCSLQTSKTCTSNADCTGFSLCQGSTTKSCTVQADCGVNTGSGKCSATNAACTVSADCAQAGTCVTPAGLVCTSDAQCTGVSAKCGGTGANCTSSATCPINAGSGVCNYKNTGGTANGPCTANTDCQAKPNTCSAPAGTVCSTIADCTSGTCTKPVGQACTANNQCDATGATCTNTGMLGQACTVAANCTVLGTCTNTIPAQPTCTTSANCTTNGKCALYPTISCTGTSNAACKTNGSCTTGNVGAVCNTNGSTTACALAGTCSNKPTACTVAGASQCGAVNGTCSTGNVGATCTTGTDCNVNNKCSNSLNNGATCTTAADCTPLKGTCSVKGTACTTATDCAKSGVCTRDSNVCWSNADCPNLPGPLNPANARCDTGGVSGSVSATLLADANGPGKTCRRNNHAYTSGPGTTASRYNFPSGNYTTPVGGELVAGAGCHVSPRYANVPRHYWKTSLEWCSDKIGNAGDKWTGYGDNSTGTCQPYKDDAHTYPRFYAFGSGVDTISNYDKAAFSRVDLTSTISSYTHTWTEGTETTTVTRTNAQEMENYANWFAYYRTRIQAVKTATSLSFLGKNTDGTFNLDETKFRVGLHTLSNIPSETFVDVQDFDVTQKGKWAKELYAIDVPLNQGTPNLDAMTRIGDYFANGGSADLAAATDPIVLSCQKNWHMLFTDGITNQPVLPSTLANNVDRTVPTLPLAITGLTTGADWPAPFRENSGTASSNSASDYATKYWATDLRTSGSFSKNDVSASSADPATWQHVNFAALSLGTDGKLAAGNQTQVETQLGAGTIQWPVPYPSVIQPDASGVDDLWHAAINGRGRFVNAKSVAELQVGMGQILADALNSQGARSGVAFTSTNLASAGDNFVYSATFQPSWGGTLVKLKVDPETGLEATEMWRAEKQLATLLTPTVDYPNPWRDLRKIVTMKEDGVAVPFQWDKISTTQQDALAPGNADRGEKVLAFLRGDQSNEDSTLGKFRKRDYTVAGALGDIVNSSARYVGAPNLPFTELNDKGYKQFKLDNAARPGRVYVGANDGMMHAFDDATGVETFAYVPSALYRPPTEFGLGSLTYQFGGLPPFSHHFFVDSTPKITDLVYLADPSTATSTDWHSLLVGGLGKGGKSYYAIDVTDSAAITSDKSAAIGEALAAGTVKWEFTDDDMGYTYGPALVTKTRAWGGRWVVVVPSGYNNKSGVGKIWFLNPADGSVLKVMETTAGTPTDPSGLAQIAGYTQNFKNYLTDQIYAGDLHGNLWRFDMLDPNDANWTVNKFAKLTDAGGKEQPVTTAPQIEVDIVNGTDRWVFVGTGRLLDDSDLTNTDVQSMYAFRDGTTRKPSTISATITRDDLEAVTDKTGVVSPTSVGWHHDLAAGQRVVTPVAAALSVVLYAGTSPNTDPCITGQPAEVFVRGYSRGESALENDDGTCCAESFASANGAVGLDIVATAPPGSGSTDGQIYVPTIKGLITQGTDGKVITINIKLPDFLYAHRMSWRILNE